MEHFDCDDPFDQSKWKTGQHYRLFDSPTQGPIVLPMIPDSYQTCIRNRFLSPEAWDSQVDAERALDALLDRTHTGCGHTCCQTVRVVVLDHYVSGRSDPHRWNSQPHHRLYHDQQSGPVVLTIRASEYPEHDETRFLSEQAWTDLAAAHDALDALLSGKVLIAA